MGNPLGQSIHDVVEEDLIADIEPIINTVADVLEAVQPEVRDKMMKLSRHHDMVVLAAMIYGLFKKHHETERSLNAFDIPRGEKAVILHKYPDTVKKLIAKWELDHGAHTKEEWFLTLLAIDWVVSCGHVGGKKSND